MTERGRLVKAAVALAAAAVISGCGTAVESGSTETRTPPSGDSGRLVPGRGDPHQRLATCLHARTSDVAATEIKPHSWPPALHRCRPARQLLATPAQNK